MDHRLESGLGVEIRLDLRIKQDRGPRIYEIEGFDDVLLLASRIGWDTRNVFEIHLDFYERERSLEEVQMDFFERERSLEWLVIPAFLLMDAVIAAQDLPNRARGTR